MHEPHFFLFTYGTLRRGEAAEKMLHGCEHIGVATVRGTLYNIADQFPALMLYGENPIDGSIWRCPASLLATLDEFEDVAGGLFRRVASNVLLTSSHDGDARLPCWLYVAGPKLGQRLTPGARLASSWQQNQVPTAKP